MRITSPLVAALLCPLTLMAETVLVSETFSDNDRGNQNPPESLAWFSTQRGNGLVLENGALGIIGAQDSARHAVAHFAPRDQPVKLKPGQTLTLSFDFTPRSPIGISTNALRFGLFGSAGDDLSVYDADGVNPDGSEAKGYVGALNIPSVSASTLVIYKRYMPGRLLTNSYAYHLLQKSGISGPLLQDETYHVELKLKRVNDGTMQIDATISGGEIGEAQLSTNDTQDIFTEFDIVGFSVFKAVTDADFRNIRITLSED